jgi:transposase-like protein
MNKTITAPNSLVEAINYFSNKEIALTFLASLRWPEGPVCPKCGGKEHSFLKTRLVWKCKACKKQFSVKTGTIFEDSPLGLDKWLPALWLLANAKNGISSYELARSLGVTQKTAWFMLHRIRLAMQSKTYTLFSGHVEADETFIGGRARFMHKKERRRKVAGSHGRHGKAAVMGLLERHGPGKHSRVKTEVVPNVRRGNTQAIVRNNVQYGSSVYTDELQSYTGLENGFNHQVINHAESYAKGQIHTNGLENFWSLLKRAIKGTYVNVEPFHLFRYLDEQVYRFNNRKTKDVARFIDTVRGIVGIRLTYDKLTGANLSTT